jgi:uncharacterized protein (UPF0297 family)
MMAEQEERPLVHVRVVAKRETVERVAQVVADALKAQGYDLIEQTVPYTIREDPSKARIFVTVR